MKRRLRAMLLVILACLCGYVIGAFKTGMQYESFSHAGYALEKTGLSAEYAPSYCLYGYTGFRDSFSQTKLIIKYQDERQALLSDMMSADGWRVAPVAAEEYLRFQEACMWEYAPVLDVPADIVFDAWYYLETSAPMSYAHSAPEGALAEIGLVGRGYEFAVYDAETGLFVFVDQFG